MPVSRLIVKMIIRVLLLFGGVLAAQTRHDAIRQKMERGVGKQRGAIQKQIGKAVGTKPAEDGWTVPWTKDPGGEFVAPVAPLEAPPAPKPEPDSPKPAAEAKPAASAAIQNFCPPVPALAMESEIRSAAARNHLSESLLRALIQRESSFDPCAVSAKGAVGLMQLMPATATALGVSDPFDPLQSIQAGARYLAQMIARYGGDLRLALSAYNAGPSAVDRYGDVPPFRETQDFVEALIGAPRGGSGTSGISQ